MEDIKVRLTLTEGYQKRITRAYLDQIAKREVKENEKKKSQNIQTA